MREKKGFTLVELLAVIAILGAIVAITFVSVNTILKDSKTSLSKTQIHNIELAAKTYYLKEGIEADDTCINVSDLIEKGYIDSKEVIDPKTRESLDGSVKVSYVDNQYMYEYQTNTCS